jgi:hypothetical protein
MTLILSVTNTPNALCRYVECRYVECHYAECCYAECRYAECHYAECRGAYDYSIYLNILYVKVPVIVHCHLADQNSSGIKVIKLFCP